MISFKDMLDFFLDNCGIKGCDLKYYEESAEVLDNLVVIPYKEYKELLTDREKYRCLKVNVESLGELIYEEMDPNAGERIGY